MNPVVVQLEQACAGFYQGDAASRVASEKLLLEFKKSPNALSDSIMILQQSNSAYAQFHAALTLREVAMTQWTQMSSSNQVELRNCLHGIILSRQASLEPFVTSQAICSWAVLYKRGWMEANANREDEMLSMILQLIQSNNTIIAAKMLLAFVSEFGAGTASSMQMPVEFHVRVKDALSNTGLRKIAIVSFKMLQDIIPSTAAATAAGGKTLSDHLVTLTVVLELVVEITNWDFQHDRESVLSWNVSSSSSSENANRFHPGTDWTSLLVTSDIVTVAFNVYGSIRELGGDRASHLARQLLIQFASLHGTVFTDEASKVAFLSKIFGGAIHVIENPMSSSSSSSSSHASEAELLDMCQLILKLVTNLRLKALCTSSSLPSLLQHLSGLSVKLLQSAASVFTANASDSMFTVSDIWQLSAFDDLLEAWVLLVTDPMVEKARMARSTDTSAESLIDLLQRNSAIVVEHYIQLQLTVASIEAVREEEEDDEVDTEVALAEQMESVASVARVHANASVCHLLQALSGGFNQLKERCNSAVTSVMAPELAQALEQMHFIVRMTGMILADNFEGEVPCIPTEMVQSQNTFENVKSIIQTLLQILEFESSRLESSSSPNNVTLSPYLSQQIWATITRVVATYVAQDENGGGIASSCFSVRDNSTQGYQIIEFLIKRSVLYFSKWPTEPQVMQKLCQLLVVMSKNRRIASMVITLPLWHDLVRLNAAAGTFLSRESALCRLPCELRGQLTEAICRTGMNVQDPQQRLAHFQEVVQPLMAKLQHLVTSFSNNTKRSEVANSTDAQERVKLVVQMYGGVIASTESSNYQVICDFCLPALPVMINFADLFHNHSQIVYMILNLFASLVEGQIAYLPPQTAFTIYSNCADLLRTYAKNNLGMRHSALEAEEESYADVLKILDLLSYLIAKDCIDFSESSSAEDIEKASAAVTDVVFFGLDMIIPLMTEQLLQFPKLCLHFFNLVSYMVENFATKLVSLQPKLFTMLIKSIIFGIQHVSKDVAKYSLAAVAELASFHYKCVRKGEAGLEAQLAQNPGMFAHLLQTILKDMLLEEFRPELLDAYATASLPLILCVGNQFEMLAQEFAARSSPHNQQGRLVQLFGQLTVGKNGNALTLDRFCRKEFKLNIKSFLTNARGFIQLR